MNKKKLSDMSDSDAEYIFSIHSDGGYFQDDVYYGTHENGWGTITNSFKCHILEAYKGKLFKLFDITEEEYNKIEMPQKIVAWNVDFPDGEKLRKVQTWKIKKRLKELHGYTKRQLRGTLATKCDELGIILTPIKEDKFTRR